MIYFFKHFFGIGATIHIGREMLCLPYAGFLKANPTILSLKSGARNKVCFITLVKLAFYSIVLVGCGNRVWFGKCEGVLPHLALFFSVKQH